MLNATFQGINRIVSSVKSEMNDLPGLNDLKKQFAERILLIVKEVVEDEINRSRYNSKLVLDEKELKLLCNKFANDEVMRSVMSGLTPNILNYINFLPVLIESYKIQTRLITQLAIGMGKQELLSKNEMIFAIMLNSGVQSSTNILIEKGGVIVLKTIGQDILPKLIEQLSSVFIKNALKSTFSGILPGLGAIAIGMFNRYSIKKIGMTTIAILSKDVSFSKDENIKIDGSNVSLLNENDLFEIAYQKIKVFIELMKIDGDKNGKEMEHICLLIENTQLTDNYKLKLYQSLTSSTVDSINFDILLKTEQIEMFVFDLLAFSTYDTSISLQEISYISRLLGKLNLKSIDHYIMY